jgi:N-acetylmuramate 1-kinase
LHKGKPDMRERLSSLEAERGTPLSIVPLAGDASTRSYFRAAYPGGRTEIVMLLPSPGENEEASFLEVQRFLSLLDLPVPRVYSHDVRQGLVVLEDLGDRLLETEVGSSTPEAAALLYAEAVDLLLRMRRAIAGSTGTCIAFTLAFDEAKLMQEMDFFMTHFVRGLCRTEPSVAAQRELNEFFTRICRMLAAEPRIFTHRDYHARNLMVQGSRLVMIDFQDARMGPAQYDLASLLRDSYVTIPEDLVETLIDRYRDALPAADRQSQERFRYVFDVMSLQRNIKALGTFGYQASVRGSGRYLSSIPRTAGYVERNAARYSEFAPYRGVLGDFIFGAFINPDIFSDSN